jgi:Mn2+/Fe2+ NRAMP family transporter
VLIPRFPLEYIVLTVNVIAVLAMPPALAFLMLLVNDRELMGEHVNSIWGNVVGVAITVFLIVAGIGFAAATVFPTWFASQRL